MMSPTYKLVDVQAQIRLLGRKAFTSTAIATAQGELDMTVGEMIEFICSRSDTKCFKTMESKKFEEFGWTSTTGYARTKRRWPT